MDVHYGKILRDLAIAAGDRGFTREDARAALVRARAATAKETINGYLRVLCSQGHLERLDHGAPGRGRRAIYRLRIKGHDYSE